MHVGIEPRSTLCMFVPDVGAIKLWCLKVSESELHIEWFVWFERKQNHVKLIIWFWGLEFWWILRGSVPYCSILYHDIWFAALPCQSVQRWIVGGSGSALKDDHGQFGTLGAPPLSSRVWAKVHSKLAPEARALGALGMAWGALSFRKDAFLRVKTYGSFGEDWGCQCLSWVCRSPFPSFPHLASALFIINWLSLFCDWKQSPSQVVPSLVRIVRCWGQGTLVHPACLVVNCHYNKCICIICSYVYVLASMLGFWQSGWYSKCHANSRGTRCRSACQYFSDTFEFCNQHLNSMKVGRREADSFWTLF